MIFRKLCFLSFIESNANLECRLYPSRTSFRYPRRHRVLASYLQHLAYVLVFIPPILVGLVSALYGIRSIIAFNKSRTEFNELLSSHSNLTSSNYFRFMRIAGIQGVCAVPIGCHLLYYNAQGNALHPSVSWESAHGRLTTSLQSSGAQTP